MQRKSAIQVVGVITVFVILTSLYLHYSPSNGLFPGLTSPSNSEAKLHPLQEIHPGHFQALNLWKSSHLDFNDVEGTPHLKEIVEEEVPDHLLPSSQRKQSQSATNPSPPADSQKRSTNTIQKNNQSLRSTSSVASTTVKNTKSGDLKDQHVSKLPETTQPAATKKEMENRNKEKSSSKSSGKGNKLIVDETSGTIHFRGDKKSETSTSSPVEKKNPSFSGNVDDSSKSGSKSVPGKPEQAKSKNIRFRSNDKITNSSSTSNDRISLQDTFKNSATSTSSSAGVNANSVVGDLPSLKNMEKALRCFNQSRCIQPELQLKKHYNVYYCKHVSYGVRFYYLAREGLLLHPMIHLVDNPDNADVIIYLPESANWKKTECNQPKYWHKIVMLDEGDGQHIFRPSVIAGPNDAAAANKASEAAKGFLLNFKRSYVQRDNGKFGGYMNYAKDENVFPMTYTIADAYIRPEYLQYPKRDIQILCSLRGGDYDPVRLRVRQWVEEYGKARGLSKYVAGEINTASRTVVSKQYFDQMYHSQVIVTSNPSHWEGDFRFCEAMASGSLIFIDHMYVPRAKPFIENKHVIYYSNTNKTDLFMKLDAFFVANAPMVSTPWLSSALANVQDTTKLTLKDRLKVASTIAMSGYMHAMRYHRAANLMDYVFRTLHVRELAVAEGKEKLLSTSLDYAKSLGGYKDHGYVLRLQVLEKQAKLNKRRNQHSSRKLRNS